MDRVGVVIDVPPEVYEHFRLVVHLASFLCAQYGGDLRHPLRALTRDLSLGLQYGNTKHRLYDHNRAHHLPQLLEELRDDSGIVSVKHVPKQRCQG